MVTPCIATPPPTGELQRKIGVKTLEVGGNAVIGYRQRFDLEGESGIVVRGIGTCVRLVTGPSLVQLPLLDDSSPHHHGDESPPGSDGPPSPTKIISESHLTHPHTLHSLTALAPLGDPVTGVSTGSTELHPSLPRPSSVSQSFSCSVNRLFAAGVSILHSV